jgi:membrane peptidoglycan carboxypeptidase
LLEPNFADQFRNAQRCLEAMPYIKSITTGAGDILYKLNPKPVQAFSTDIADTVNYALQKVVESGTGKAAKELGRPVAGKTGTTNDNKSALFAGYTPELSTAVMFVKDGPDGQPMTLSGTGGMNSVTGGSYPARIFTAYMKGALKHSPVQKFAGLPSGQPNGANPTDNPSPSAVPTVTTAPTTTTSPTATPAKTVVVPDVRRVSVADATAVLKGLGLNVALVYQEGDESSPLLFVLDQDPTGLEQVELGSTVTLTVVLALP